MKNSQTLVHNNIYLKILFLATLPAILLGYSYWHILHLSSADSIKRLSLIAHKGLIKIEAASNPQEYIASKIHQIFNKSDTPKYLHEEFQTLNRKLNTNIKYIIWSKGEPILFSNYGKISKAMKGACLNIYNNQVFEKHRKTIKCTRTEKAKLKDLFGPQFIVEHSDRCYQKKDFLLIPDIARNHPRLWIKANQKFMLIAFITEKQLQKTAILKTILQNLESKDGSIKYGVQCNNESISCSKEIQDILLSGISSNSRSKIKTIHNKIILSNYINDQTTSFALIHNQQASINWKLLRMLIAYFFIISLFILYSKQRDLFNNKLPFRILLQHKLFGIIVLFNLIPMSVFMLFSNDYLSQLRHTEIAEIYKQGIGFFKQIDNAYISEKTYQIKNLTKSISKLKPSLAKNGITATNVVSFLKQQKPKVLKFTLIASSTKKVATTKGVYVGNKLVTRIKGLHRSAGYEGFAELGQVMVLMGELFLAKLNNMPISAERSIKLDFIAEALEQTTTLAMVQKFYESNNQISHFGIGEIITPIFTYVFSVNKRLAIDYALFYSWDVWMLKENYINRIQSALTRNKLGLKVILLATYGFQLPANLELNSDLLEFSLNLKDNTKSAFIQTCQWENKLHYIIGFKGLRMISMKYIGLYPCDKIDQKISKQKHGFILFGILSFLISVAFGLSISRQILLPVNDLKTGINALKNHDLTFKMPHLGQNEFGEIANIINETIEDIKELQKTDDFNTKIFSNVGKEINFGHIQVYGEASVFSKLGKDYLDIFLMEEQNKIGIIWGNINKLGVASTLLAAFLKSCTLIYKDLLNEPQEFLSNVESIVKKINDNENKKILSFQYITLDLISNELEIANARCQMPIIVNSSTNKTCDCTIGKQFLHKNETFIAFSPNFSQINSFEKFLIAKPQTSPRDLYNKIISDLVFTGRKTNIEIASSSSMVILKVLKDIPKRN